MHEVLKNATNPTIDTNATKPTSPGGVKDPFGAMPGKEDLQADIVNAEGVENPSGVKNATNPTSMNPSVPLLYYIAIASVCSGTSASGGEGAEKPRREMLKNTTNPTIDRNATNPTNRTIDSNSAMRHFDYAQGDTFGVLVAHGLNDVLMQLRAKCKIVKMREHVNIVKMVAVLWIPVFTMFTA